MGSGVSPRWAHGMGTSCLHHFHVADISGPLVEVARAERVVGHTAQSRVEAAHVVGLGLLTGLVLAVDRRVCPRLLAESSTVDVDGGRRTDGPRYRRDLGPIPFLGRYMVGFFDY